jgi:hypothetical protein
MPQKKAAEPSSMEVGDHKDLGDPGVSGPPFRRGHVGDDHRTNNGVGLISEESRRRVEDGTARPLPCEELAPIVEAIDPRPDPEVDVTWQQGRSRGHRDVVAVGAQHIEARSSGRRPDLRDLRPRQIHRHVPRHPAQPASGCDQVGGLVAVVGTNQSHGSTVSRSAAQATARRPSGPGPVSAVAVAVTRAVAVAAAITTHDVEPPIDDRR